MSLGPQSEEISVLMGGKSIAAKNAEVRGYANMAAIAGIAGTVVEARFVSTADKGAEPVSEKVFVSTGAKSATAGSVEGRDYVSTVAVEVCARIATGIRYVNTSAFGQFAKSAEGGRSVSMVAGEPTVLNAKRIIQFLQREGSEQKQSTDRTISFG
uniref:Uncharacterized protein n=1 Tax=Chromera velia CCMP2878 TaxID=1169474 RepID=A0A0G4FRI1_9ALVE|eukprot:Cvel_458.t1-p1 / transcript=Cvel_458.t1 / gene=Cvel_458 / organism=Chromera_velia_CCMP2878 / gene_product=hypothetical protein / transcript_product=hypothetical protein / location=Cvel_scaffold14:202587-203051(-) / protein_length=155 / sequence_SO=supercontig / SO=protein_coding / is_pseudo=false